MRQKTRRQIVNYYSYKFRQLTEYALSQRIFREHGELFNDLDHVRYLVRLSNLKTSKNEEGAE